MRINLFGGPGSGKTITAAWLFSALACDGYDIALIPEFIKTYAYRHEIPKSRSFDQLYIFASQLALEEAPSFSDIKHIVTESPVALGCFYAKINKCPCWKHLLAIIKDYDLVHPSTDIFLERSGIPYLTSGRYQTEKDAINIDKELRIFLKEDCEYLNLHVVNTLDRSQLYNLVKNNLEVDEIIKLKKTS